MTCSPTEEAARGPAHRSQHRQAAGDARQGLKPPGAGTFCAPPLPWAVRARKTLGQARKPAEQDTPMAECYPKRHRRAPSSYGHVQQPSVRRRSQPHGPRGPPRGYFGLSEMPCHPQCRRWSVRPQASEGEAQHGPFLRDWTFRSRTHGPRFTISLKRSTQNLQLSTSWPADYPIYRA
jgi:hypothetical protein